MTRTLLLSLVFLVLVLAVAGWTVRAVRWTVTLPVRRGRTSPPGRLRVA